MILAGLVGLSSPALALDEHPVEPKRKNRFMAKIGGGPTVRGVYEVPIFGVTLDVMLGARTSHGGDYGGVIRAFRGNTSEGLGVWYVALGGELAWWLSDRAYLGLSPRVSSLFITRATPDDAFFALGVGGVLLGGVDLWQDDEGEHGVWAELRGGGDGLLIADPVTALYGGSASIGYRY